MIVELTSAHDESPVLLVVANVCGIMVNSQGKTVVSDAGGSLYVIKESPEVVADKVLRQARP